MGNHHSEQEQQTKGNLEAKPESSPKPKKDTDIWSSFRNKTKASTLSQTSPFKPVPPNLFKGIPDFTGTGTSSVCKKQLPLGTPPVEDRPLDSVPAVPAFSPQAAHMPNQLWALKEPSAYNISWERPQINSPMPTPISSFVFPSVPHNTSQRDFQKAVSHTTTTTSAAPTTSVASPCANLSPPRPKTPPRLPKKAAPETLPPVKPAMTREPNLPRQPAMLQDPTLPQQPAVLQNPVVKDAIKATTQDAPTPFLFTAATSEKTQDSEQSAAATADHKTASADKNDKPASSQESNIATHNTDGKNGDKVKRRTFVISEKTHAEIMSRLAYVEKQKLISDAPVAQKLAVVRKALNGVSYAEAVKKSQPKVNPARREAKAKLSKKVKISKSKTQSVANPAEGGSSVPQQLANHSPASLPLKGVPDMADAHKRNTTAAPEQTAHVHQNEQSSIFPADIDWEKKLLEDVNSAISRMIYPEHCNLTQNSCLLSGISPSVSGKYPSPFCQAGNAHSPQSMVMTSETQPRADLKAISASSHQSKSNQICQSPPKSDLQDKPVQAKLRVSEQISRVDREKVKQSVKCVPLQVNSEPGPMEDSAAVDTSAELKDCSDVSTIPHELSNATGASEESQMPLITPHKPATSPVSRLSTSHIIGSSKDILCASTDEQCTLTAEVVPPIVFAQSPPNISAQVHHHIPYTIPAEVSEEQRNTKLPNNSTPQLTNMETYDKPKNREERLLVRVPPPSPQPFPRREGRWHPFTTDQSCVQKVRCQHRQNGSLPKNIIQWLNVSQNHLCEPSWVTTASLAASIALSARLDREDSRQ
ncbi:hypothetical protein ACEWY4_007846 [Coilia grayii]|uniref:Uncharacterized protein n=1 Tax=Coilia grayii TaxID=363190 RepID=A0ABD1K980_9TELE